MDDASTRNRRIGLTLVEVLVAVAILSILGAAVITLSSPESSSDDERIELVASALFDMTQAIAGFEPTLPPASFRQTVQIYPGRLSHLTAPITTAQRNSCGNFYTGAGFEVDRWKGPYYSVELPTTGYHIAPGFFAEDSLVRVPATVPFLATDVTGTLSIIMKDVTVANAYALSLKVDGDSTGTIGRVRFNPVSPVGEIFLAVEYQLTVRGC